MARQPDDFEDGAAVVLIKDEFSDMPEHERARRIDKWLASLGTGEGKHLDVTGADLLDEARRESGW